MAIDRMRLDHFLKIHRFRDRYIAAVKKLKADGIYQVFVDWHADPNVGVVAHDNATFLHWHRAFLRLFEIRLQAADETLQKAIDASFDAKDVISLPYWDYSRLNSEDPANATGRIWADTFMGPTGTGASMTVPSGEFAGRANWPIVRRNPLDLTLPLVGYVPSPANELSRDLASSGLPLASKREERVMRSRIGDFDNNLFRLGDPIGGGSLTNPADSGSFRAVVEGFAPVPHFAGTQSNTHNGVHMWVGGQMGSVPRAPNDPVFWLHHANIDRIWAIWQTRHPDLATQYPSDAAIVAARTPAPPDGNPDAITASEPMVPWDAAAKPWNNAAAALLFTTDVITPADVNKWSGMGAGLGGYRIRGVKSRRLKF